eukprot:g8058.t1
MALVKANGRKKWHLNTHLRHFFRTQSHCHLIMQLFFPFHPSLFLRANSYQTCKRSLYLFHCTKISQKVNNDYVAISDEPTVTQPGLFRGSGRLLAGLLGLMLVVCSVRPLATAYAEGVLFASHRSQRQPGPARNRPGPARNQPGPAQNRPGHGGPSGLQLVPPSIFDPKAPDKFHASGGGARGAMVDGERSWPSCVFLYGMLLQHSRQDCLGNLLDGPTGPPAQRQASYVKGSQPLCTETWLRLKQPGEKAVLTWPFAFLTGRPGDQLHGETWCWPSGELAQEKMRQIEGVIGFDSAVLKRFVVSAVLQNGTAQQAAAYLQDPKPSPEEQDLLCKV